MRYNKFGGYNPFIYHKPSDVIPEWMKQKIARVEYMFRRYYGDDLTKFTGTTKSQANAWLMEVEDEYRGICDELHHGRLREDDFSMR